MNNVVVMSLRTASIMYEWHQDSQNSGYRAIVFRLWAPSTLRGRTSEWNKKAPKQEIRKMCVTKLFFRLKKEKEDG